VFLSEPRFEGLPCILETPRKDGLAADLERCRKLRARGVARRA
jgi:endonuclease IV